MPPPGSAEQPAPQPPPPSTGAPSGARAEAGEIDPEAAEAVMAEMAEVRRQLSQVPAAVVVANHAMGLYELGAIHLSQEPPNIPEAKVAIDAFGLLVEGLQGRLGEAEPTLRDALGQIRLAFVQLSQQGGGGAPLGSEG